MTSLGCKSYGPVNQLFHFILHLHCFIWAVKLHWLDTFLLYSIIDQIYRL